jgi:hypothetical protein
VVKYWSNAEQAGPSANAGGRLGAGERAARQEGGGFAQYLTSI